MRLQYITYLKNVIQKGFEFLVTNVTQDRPFWVDVLETCTKKRRRRSCLAADGEPGNCPKLSAVGPMSGQCLAYLLKARWANPKVAFPTTTAAPEQQK